MLAGGIDEAGYGPKLGPMTVCSFAAETPGLDVLHSMFGEGFPVEVRDSKRLYSASRGLRRLEASVLPLIGAAVGKVPSDGLGLLRLLAPDAIPDIRAIPWYRDAFRLPLPCAAEPEKTAVAAEAVKKTVLEHGVRLGPVRVKVFTAARLNSIWTETPNKQAASYAALKTLLPPLTREGEAAVAVDRQGGRKSYGPWLAGIFGGGLCIQKASGERAEYILPDRGLRVMFEPKADSLHPLVAAAGMTAKYVRELLMRSFFRYWRERGVEPSDGYGGRFRPFLAAACPLLEEEGLSTEHIFRRR